MARADTDLERIGAYVKGNLYGWFVEVAPHLVIGPQILERIATIEQELKDQRELMAVRFDAMDRRFEATNARIAERFDAVDRRFEDMAKLSSLTSASRRWARGPTSDSQRSMSNSRT